MSRHALLRSLLWASAPTMVLLASCGKNPYLFALRHVEVPLVLLISVTAVAILGSGLGTRCVGRRLRQVLTGLFLTAMTITLGQDLLFRYQRHQVLAADADMRRMGRHFMVGYTDFTEVAVLAQRGLIGGVYISKSNARNRTADELRHEIESLQELRHEAKLPALLVAADQEGGSVSHMSPPLAPQPALASLVTDGPDNSLESRARAYGELQGQGLAALGINMNFGPVVDLMPQGKRPTFDTHTLLAKRAISANPTIVTRIAAAYGEGLMRQGVTPTLKHFPGLGRVTVDTHHVAGRVSSASSTLADSDWRPFRELAHSGAALMVGHVVVDAIDPSAPASLSAKVINGVLRKQWGFTGLIVTDDLNMGAVYRIGIGEAAKRALQAGADMVLISYDPDQYYRAMWSVTKAYRAGEVNISI